MYYKRTIKRISRLSVLLICMVAISLSGSGQKKKAATPAAPVEGALTPAAIQKALDEAYEKFKDLKEGKNADYIKELAKVDPNIYGIALITTDGTVYTKGDLQSAVSIQSISKVFTMARVIEEQGPKAVMEKIGVDATGMRFNSIELWSCRKVKRSIHWLIPGRLRLQVL